MPRITCFCLVSVYACRLRVFVSHLNRSSSFCIFHCFCSMVIYVVVVITILCCFHLLNTKYEHALAWCWNIEMGPPFSFIHSFILAKTCIHMYSNIYVFVCLFDGVFVWCTLTPSACALARYQNSYRVCEQFRFNWNVNTVSTPCTLRFNSIEIWIRYSGCQIFQTQFSFEYISQSHTVRNSAQRIADGKTRQNKTRTKTQVNSYRIRYVFHFSFASCSKW